MIKRIYRIVLIFVCGLFFCDCYSQQAPGIEWQKCLGGDSVDIGSTVKQTTDDGYIVIGSSKSINGNATANNGHHDYWLVKLDTSGNVLWENNFGGTGEDVVKVVSQNFMSQ